MTPCTRPVPRSRKASFPAEAWRCCDPLRHLADWKPRTTIRKTGIDIVRKAVGTPARQIAVNAGEDGSIVVGKISENDSYAYGYDAQEGQYGDLVSKCIVDPTKVVRTALQDAASIAELLMTTEAMVAEKPKKETPMPAMPPGGGMDY
jgi:chaperonin GroEL